MKKYIHTTILVLFALFVNAQDREAVWMTMGIQQVDKNLSAVSPVFGNDHYTLTNYPTCRGEFFAHDKYYRFDMSGIFYFISSMKNDNTPDEALNYRTTTDRSMEHIVDYTSWEWMATKVKTTEKNWTRGLGWQFGVKRFGFSDKGLLKANIAGEIGYPDAGPYSYRGTLYSGMNYQWMRNFSKYVDVRAALVINAMAGIGKYGAMAYPELGLNVHFWRMSIRGMAAYETTFLYAPTQNAFKSAPADNLGKIQGLRYDISFGIDLQGK